MLPSHINRVAVLAVWFASILCFDYVMIPEKAAAEVHQPMPVHQLSDSRKLKKPRLISISDEIRGDLSEEEITWYNRFQNGMLIFDGWVEISRNIVNSFPQEEQERVSRLVQRLGAKIGMEWCRKNDSRKIDTTMLRGWGEQLRTAADSGSYQLEKALVKIESEVDLLLLQNREDVSLMEPRS